jgi:hypothetical protein
MDTIIVLDAQLMPDMRPMIATEPRVIAVGMMASAIIAARMHTVSFLIFSSPLGVF